MLTRAKFSSLCLVATSALIVSPAAASTASGTLPITLVIQGVCVVSSASTLAFGAQTAIASNLDTTSTIGVTCTSATPYSIGLSAGAGTGATVAARQLTGGSTTVPYTIYQDANRTQLWGVTIGADTQASTGTGATQSFTAYGRIPPLASPTTGSYSDTVAVTVTY